MTREEQIIKIGAQFAIDETDGQTSGRAASMRGVLLSAFRAGAHWADSHPNWISVEDELPKEHFVDTSSKWVLVSIKGSVFIDSYSHKHKEWVNNGKCVDYWMPLPQPPRKEE